MLTELRRLRVNRALVLDDLGCEVAVILYGFGADLGDFRLFADDLFAELLRQKKFTRSHVMIKETSSRAAFFDTLASIPSVFKIKELHVSFTLDRRRPIRRIP